CCNGPADRAAITIDRHAAATAGLRRGAANLVSMQGAGIGGDVSDAAAGRWRIVLYAATTPGAGAGGASDVFVETKPRQSAIARRTRQENRVQPFLSQSHLLHADGADDYAVSATVANGESGRA